MAAETKHQQAQRRKLTVLKKRGKITAREFRERMFFVYNPQFRVKEHPKTCLIRAAFLNPPPDLTKAPDYLTLRPEIREWVDRVIEAHKLKDEIRVPREFFTPIALAVGMTTTSPPN